MEGYLDKLNQQQRDAVLYTDGPQLVIAGAGSGKTRVLTYKIVHLLENGYEPWRILALTFTNKAAREMRERIEALTGKNIASKLWMGTFHSIFARILRANAERLGFKRDFTIYDTADTKSLIKTIIKEMELDEKIYKPSVVMSAISNAKNALYSPQKYATSAELIEADQRVKRPKIHSIYKAYRDRCLLANAMDFDDLLYYTNVLFRDNIDICRHYQEFFRYILVDEYQDTNFAQHLIVSQLTKANNHICVVGDDAQSIYSFRGANIKNILTLKTSYPELKVFKLEQNYRSTQTIINAANTLIAKNKEQIPKNVFSRKDIGSLIEVVQSYSDYEEAFLVANRISQLKMRLRDSYEDYAILYRTNAQSRVLEESLRKRNIPYRIYGGLSFYQRKEVKDAIAYFRLAINPSDDEALKRILNYPARGIGETTKNKLIAVAIRERKSIWELISSIEELQDVMHRNGNSINSAAYNKIKSFVELIQTFIDMNEQQMNAKDIATEIIRKTQLLSSLMSDRTPESIAKQENLQELIAGIDEFVSGKIEEGDDNILLTNFLAEVSLATDQDIQDSSDERVTLMTVHAAKGLEFGNIFIVGVEEDLFPSDMCNSPSEIEEERRLLYVAITRAKQNCIISYASSRFHNGQTKTCRPSRFIKDIDNKYLSFSAGNDFARPDDFVNPTSRYRVASNQFTKITPQQSMSTTKESGNESIHQASELNEGMMIQHNRFGIGRILRIDEMATDVRIVVEFKETGTKTLILRYARFNILSDEN